MLLLGFSILSVYMLDISKHIRRALAHVEATELSLTFSQTGNLGDLPKIKNGLPIEYTLYSSTGDALYVPKHLVRPLRQHEKVIYPGRWLSSLHPPGRIMNVPVFLDNGNVLMVAFNDVRGRELTNQILNHASRFSGFILLPTILIVSSLIIFILLRWTLRPVFRAIEIVKQITPNHTYVIPVSSVPKEIAPLVDATNDAMNRLSSAYQAEQRFVADAAHALRTPLTVISLLIHKIKKENHSDFKQIISEIENLKSLVEQLLQLARLESADPQAYKSNKVKLVRLIREAIASNLPLFESKNRSIVFCNNIANFDNAHADFITNSHPMSLVLHNLIENSLSHGEGDLKISFDSDKDHLFVCFSDDGKSPPKDIRDNLFNRFFKENENSQGAGLGLSIVSQVIKNLGGKVYFCNTRNTRIEFSLPIT